ncbi:MAG TPA: hypothetical protein VE861_00080, partial [Gemmatimonadaceae bacterium]|nr:hypothetical protein [Gemmatimonadaceae bacterium]
MSVMPRVERLALPIGALGAAMRAGSLPGVMTFDVPRTREQWLRQIQSCREPMMGRAWANTLREAMRPTGAAAARLARVSG